MPRALTALEQNRCSYPLRSVEQRLLDVIADRVHDHHVDLLDYGRVFARCDQQMIARGPHAFALRAGKADGCDADVARDTKCSEDVWRAAGCGECEQQVATLAEPLHLTGKHLLEAIVV